MSEDGRQNWDVSINNRSFQPIRGGAARMARGEVTLTSICWYVTLKHGEFCPVFCFASVPFSFRLLYFVTDAFVNQFVWKPKTSSCGFLSIRETSSSDRDHKLTCAKKNPLDRSISLQKKKKDEVRYWVDARTTTPDPVCVELERNKKKRENSNTDQTRTQRGPGSTQHLQPFSNYISHESRL